MAASWWILGGAQAGRKDVREIRPRRTGIAADYHGEEESFLIQSLRGCRASQPIPFLVIATGPRRPAGRADWFVVPGPRRLDRRDGEYLTKLEETDRETCRIRIPMRLGAARLRRFITCAQRILLRTLVIERGERAADGGWNGHGRLSAAVWPPLALRLLPRFLARLSSGR